MKLKRLFLLMMLLAAVSLLSGCQSKPKADAVQTDAVSQQAASVQTAAATAEPTAMPAPAFEPIDWSIVTDAPASDFTYEIIQEYDDAASSMVDAVRLTGYTGSASIVKVPDMIEGMYVRQAVEKLFMDNTTITYVALPAFLQINQAGYMFENCTSLVQVRMPETRALIPARMFRNCTSLREVTFPEKESTGSSDGGVKTHAFENCTALTSITLPDDVDSISNNAFAGCTSLETVIARSVKIIEQEAFLNCSALHTLEISAYDPQIIGPSFVGCTSLKDVTLAKSGESTQKQLINENGAYYIAQTSGEDTRYTLAFVLPGYEGETIPLRPDTEKITQGALAGTMIKSIEIPASVKEIDTSAFACCPNLETVKVAAGSQLNAIRSSAFYDCPVLKRIDLSSAPMSLNVSDDFDDLPALEQLVKPGQDPNATPAPVYTEEEITAAINASVAPHRAQMDAAGYKLTVRMDYDKLRSITIDTTAGQIKDLDSELLRSVTLAILDTPQAGFTGTFRDQVSQFSFTESGFVQDSFYRMELHQGYMYYYVSLSHQN